MRKYETVPAMATTAVVYTRRSFPMAGWTKVERAIDCLLDLVIIIIILLLSGCFACPYNIQLYTIHWFNIHAHKAHMRDTWDGMGCMTPIDDTSRRLYLSLYKTLSLPSQSRDFQCLYFFLLFFTSSFTHSLFSSITAILLLPLVDPQVHYCHLNIKQTLSRQHSGTTRPPNTPTILIFSIHIQQKIKTTVSTTLDI